MTNSDMIALYSYEIKEIAQERTRCTEALENIVSVDIRIIHGKNNGQKILNLSDMKFFSFSLKIEMQSLLSDAIDQYMQMILEREEILLKLNMNEYNN